MAIVPTGLIEVRKVRGKGRGVFARELIPEGTEFEKAPILVLPEGPTLETPLIDYVFEWAPDKVALVLGFGSLYNHSYEPNARYYYGGPKAQLYVALRDIQPGEEITINYNSDPEDQAPVGFEVKD